MRFSHQLFKSLMLLFSVFILSTASITNAQTAALPPPPLHTAIDSHGVDIMGGSANLPGMAVSIGTSQSGIKRDPGRSWAGRDNFTGMLLQMVESDPNQVERPVGTYMTVNIGGHSDMYLYQSNGTYLPFEGATATFSCSGTLCTHTATDGTVALFDKTLDGNFYDSSIVFMTSNPWQPKGALTQIIKPDGEVIQVKYAPYNSGSYLSINSVTSSLGWMIKYDSTSIKAINTSVEYCDPNATSCNTLVNVWPSFTSSAAGFTNALNKTYKLTTSYTGTLPTSYTRVYTLPSGVTHTYVFGNCYSSTSAITCNQYNPYRDKVISLTIGAYNFSYGHTKYEESAPDGKGLLKNTGPDGEIDSWIIRSKPVYFVDKLNRKTSYFYGWIMDGQITQINDPDATPIPTTPTATGGYAKYAYDSRGNITSITTYPKTSGTPLVMSATYPETGATTCSNPKTCNKPLTITDQAGVTTTYTYDPTHGGLTSETKPAINGVQAQIRYGYSQQIPYVKNSSGALVASTPVWRLTSISKCMTANLAACVGTADEQRTEISNFTYNLLPQTTTVKLGNNTLPQTTTTSYDIYGNVTSVAGPRSGFGTYDTTYYFYNALRQKIGEIGTDPDGYGPRLRQATRITYNDDGKVTSIEKGKVFGTTLSDLTSAMTVLQQQTTEYSATTGLPIVERYYAGGVLQKVTQKSYNSDLRLECTAQRLNPAAFGSLPASACTLGTAGTEGGDRITKITYDATGAVLKTTSAFGTSLQRDDRVNTYDPTNGLLVSEADGLGNKTAYKYDDFKRPLKTVYPQPGNGTAESTTDYTQTNYRSGSSLVDSVRLRDSQMISFGYDSVARVSTKSNAISESFTYNNFNQIATHTYSSTGGVAATSVFSFNALGWLNFESRAAGGVSLGPVSYLYDNYGRRSRLTWPDEFYVTYDYTVSGYPGNDLQTIKESSGTLLGSFVYDDYARRTSMTRGNGVITSYGYDDLSRLKTLGTDLSGTADDISETFGYTTSSQVKSRTLNVTNSNYIYAPTASGTTSYTPNALNQISTVTTGSTVSMSYDGRGNLTTDATTGSYFAYNADNLLLNATKTGVTTTLSYDAEKRLYSVLKSGVTTKFIYDGNKLIAETDGSNNILRRYVPGPGTDEPITWYEGSGSTDKRYYTADRQGSIVGVTLQSGMSTSINAYDEYGIQKNSNIGRFQYTGQTWLSEIGLYYYKARFYNPSLGRFMQADPIGYKDGMNWYAYVGNDSVNRTDPTGTQCYSAYQNCYTINYMQYDQSKVNPAIIANNETEKAKEAAKTTAEIAVTVGTTVVAPELIAAKLAVTALRTEKVAAAATDFFAGTKYTPKVLAQMKKGDLHSFPESVRTFQDAGKVTSTVGGDGSAYEMLKIPGGYQGKEGAFEFIKDAEGVINHRFFNPAP